MGPNIPLKNKACRRPWAAKMCRAVAPLGPRLIGVDDWPGAPAQQVSQAVGQLRVEDFDQLLLGEVGVGGVGALTKQEVPQAVHRDVIRQFDRVNHVALCSNCKSNLCFTAFFALYHPSTYIDAIYPQMDSLVIGR